MKNENAAVNKIEKVNSIPFTATVDLVPQNGNEGSRVEIVMDNPFPEEEFGALRLTFVNETKTDNWGNSTKDISGEKRKGRFELYAKRYLRTNPELKMSGAIYNRVYHKKGDDIEYISIELNNPFEGDKVLRVYIKNISTGAAFGLVAEEHLNVTEQQSNKGTGQSNDAPSGLPF